MSDYTIITDSTADLPKEYYVSHDITCLELSCILDGVTYGPENELDEKQFYDKVRKGSMPTTSQVNPEQARSVIEPLLQKYDKVLYIAFSSGLSGTYQSGVIAADELMEEYKGKNIVVIDSLCASLGEGLLVHKAVQQKESGMSFEELCDYVKDLIPHLCHMFTVDDLFHLHRGGRVSKATAILGTMINIKPLLHVDNEGHLINLDKCRGRKKSLISLVDMMDARLGDYKDKNDVIFISHGDCIEDAKFVADEVTKRYGITNFVFNYVGPVIGSHSGPGTVALFFVGDHR